MNQQPLITIWIVMIYFLFGYIGHIVAIPPGIATPVWPASGFALSMALIFQRKAWLGIFIGAFLITIEPIINTDFATIKLSIFWIGISVSIGILLQAIAGAWLINRIIGKDIFHSVNSFLLFSSNIFFICLISSSIGVSALYLGEFISEKSFLETWITWLLGDTAGILLITPMVHLWNPTWNLRKIEFKLLFLLVLFYLILTFITLFSFGFFFAGKYSFYPLVYLSWPILLLFALNFEKIHTYLAIFIVSVVAVIMTVHKSGPFYVQNINHSLLLLQSFIIVTTVTLISISILSIQSRAFNTQLQNKVDEQTNALSLMINELHHRVKNNFQFILTFLSVQKESIVDKNALLVIEQTMKRIYSISSLHDLFKVSDIDSVNIKTYIQGIIETFVVQEKRIMYCPNIEDIVIKYDLSIAIGFILNELIINSHKYAFDSIDKPSIHVDFYKEKDKFIFEYLDNGIGFEVDKHKNNHGLGFELIYAYVHKNNAKITLSSESGTQLKIIFNESV
ncbi:MAG: MASE1 domain-containing protein [Sulfuricurvum sp.]|uniref:MASE1 domain-containing protein n=1 Tax=Sulfuricurvum sp. TaxID=2025608 RepID=UPI00262D228A|nr:MASE1 domain-containing protein [Sulfuricurvum sp.]MDD2829058.1 MASE1 domain-containing protein [Sulfuricurvum sp.]MDD4949705.1 MASE1 domain-containing protein [Sulfuricurvum sp.]